MAAAEIIGYLADFPTPEERVAITEGRRAYEATRGARWKLALTS